MIRVLLLQIVGVYCPDLMNLLLFVLLTILTLYVLLKHGWVMMLWTVRYLFQVATALLVAGSTLTLWRPKFVCTSSYSSVVQSARLLVSNLRLIPINAHVTWCPRCSIDRAMAVQTKTEHYYSAHNVSTRLSFDTWASVHDSDHYDVYRIFVGHSWELRCWIVRSSDGGQRWDKRTHNSTTKVSFCTIIIRLCQCMIAIMRV